MKPNELFLVGFRLLAIVSLFFAFEHVLYYLDARLGWTTNSVTSLGGTVEGYLIYPVFYGLAGGIGLTFATSITDSLYRSETTRPDDEIDQD